MKLKLVVILAFMAFPSAGIWAQTPTLSCRPLDAQNNYVAPDEKIVGDQACKIVAAPAPQKQLATQTSASNVTASSRNVPPSQTEQAASVPGANTENPGTAVDPLPAEAPEACLIVASAEGHRFRDSMIAGALTGGIGFAAGAIAGGAKYAYRDSFNLPQEDVREKYKGKELQKIQASGVHVIVVSAKDKTGSEIEDARKSCHER